MLTCQQGDNSVHNDKSNLITKLLTQHEIEYSDTHTTLSHDNISQLTTQSHALLAEIMYIKVNKNFK